MKELPLVPNYPSWQVGATLQASLTSKIIPKIKCAHFLKNIPLAQTEFLTENLAQRHFLIGLQQIS